YPIMLRGAIPEVLLQVDVALVRVVEVESYDDLASVDKSRQFLAHIAGRVQLVDFRNFALGLRRLDAGDLGDFLPGRAVFAPVKLGPQTSGLSHRLRTSLVHDHHIDVVMGLPRVLLIDHNALFNPGLDDVQARNRPLQALQRLAHRGGDCRGYGLRRRHGGDLDSRFRPGDAVQIPPRYDADDVEDDAGIGGGVRPDLVVDPVAHQRRDSRVLGKSLPYRPAGRHPLRRHTRSSLL